jgi:hypothetical protein
VVALAVGTEAPAVVRTADAVAFDVGAAAIEHHIRGLVGRREVGLHVRAVGVEQHDLAAFTAAIEREVLAEEAHRRAACGYQSDASAIMNQPRG